jgi:hypothetical protein
MDYKDRRSQNIARNRSLLENLKLQQAGSAITTKNKTKQTKKKKAAKIEARPSRTSARIASKPEKATYNEDEVKPIVRLSKKQVTKRQIKESLSDSDEPNPGEIEAIVSGWSRWAPTADPPVRDEDGTFHFESDPDFLPNKSPEEMLHEGCFGGSYFRSLYSRVLKMKIEGDWNELPPHWLKNLNIEGVLINPMYDPEVNKYGVACGQSIEEWEANGWINHQFDVRGWFQWYIRFFQGRRCEDDERQISRWKRCVGEKGRWKRTLLKKYQQAGIRTVNDEGLEEIEGVSPAIHQTCLHWAYEIKQDDLDRWWDEN